MRPPKTIQTAMPIGRRQQAAIMFMSVGAVTMAAPPHYKDQSVTLIQTDVSER